MVVAGCGGSGCVNVHIVLKKVISKFTNEKNEKKMKKKKNLGACPGYVFIVVVCCSVIIISGGR